MLADVGEPIPAAATDNESTFRALGYRQTLATAAQGGKANHNGFRFRNGAMRAIGRSFRGQPFITGHDWGDARARGGTITDAWAEEISNDTEMAWMFDIVARAEWAIEGLKNGTIDRFSIGVLPAGEVTCTVHECPVWTGDCYCFPSETVDGVIAEWEFEGGTGVELSSVNVPAVEGTSIIEATAADVPAAVAFSERVHDLEAICGRGRRQDTRVVVGAPKGGFTPTAPPITMAGNREPPRGNHMDRALICRQLGLPITATDADIEAKFASLNADAATAGVLRSQLEDVAQLEATRTAERDAAHVESEISRLSASRIVSEKVLASLRTTAKSGRVAFDASLSLVEASAPVRPAGAALAAAAPNERGSLQSDQKPAPVAGLELSAEPDAYELNRHNPHLTPMMRKCGLSAEDVRKHGSVTINVVPQLGELAAKSA